LQRAAVRRAAENAQADKMKLTTRDQFHQTLGH
jgi:hypothetical protein